MKYTYSLQYLVHETYLCIDSIVVFEKYEYLQPIRLRHLLHLATLYLEPATHRGQDGNQMSAHLDRAQS